MRISTKYRCTAPPKRVLRRPPAQTPYRRRRRRHQNHRATRKQRPRKVFREPAVKALLAAFPIKNCGCLLRHVSGDEKERKEARFAAVFCDPIKLQMRYSARNVQFGRKAHSTPPPAIQPFGFTSTLPGAGDVGGTADVPGHPGPMQLICVVRVRWLKA